MLGDIAIAYETTRREADDEQKPFDHHLSHLAVHGFLHLIGYDHENDGDAEAMEALEQQILSQLGIPNPYTDRDPYADRERMDWDAELRTDPRQHAQHAQPARRDRKPRCCVPPPRTG